MFEPLAALCAAFVGFAGDKSRASKFEQDKCRLIAHRRKLNTHEAETKRVETEMQGEVWSCGNGGRMTPQRDREWEGEREGERQREIPHQIINESSQTI